MTETEKPFDFKRHEETAVTNYLAKRQFFENLATVVRRIIEESLKSRQIKVHSVQSRAKDPTSFGEKAASPLNDDPSRPKYTKPLEQITDLSGVRVITYFPGTLSELDSLLADEFSVVERSDKGALLLEEERLGYQSIHYLVKLTPDRAKLPEYHPFENAITEVQVRTILQHAWAEIEHDIQYKSASVIPAVIRRRFMSLAGVLEIADREFQAIQDEDRRLAEEARTQVKGGQLENVEITPDALKAFLDKRLGSDGRISDWSYDWTARLVRKLGFRTMQQVEECIRGFSDDKISRFASNNRQGQTTRFEHMLLAGMGKLFIDRHLYSSYQWWNSLQTRILDRFVQMGIEVRIFDPNSAEISAREGDGQDINQE